MHSSIVMTSETVSSLLCLLNFREYRPRMLFVQWCLGLKPVTYFAQSHTKSRGSRLCVISIIATLADSGRVRGPIQPLPNRTAFPLGRQLRAREKPNPKHLTVEVCQKSAGVVRAVDRRHQGIVL